MPAPNKGPRLGGSPAHQRMILANLATKLFEGGAITTTEAKARRLRPFAEKLITKAKRGDLHNRRQVMKVIRDKTVVHILFTELAPKYAERPGGYTRITKIGPRRGDSAPLAVIELVQEEYTPGGETTKSQPAPTPEPVASASGPATAAADTAAADTAATDTASETATEEAAGTEQADVEEPESAEAGEAGDEASSAQEEPAEEDPAADSETSEDKPE